MKHLKKIFLIMIVIIPCALLFAGCSFFETEAYVTDIKQTSVVGNETTYTVYYSDGSTSLFTVENGKDGQDGQDLTIESIKQYCEKNNLDFEMFLKEYLTVTEEQENVQTSTAKAIQSAVSVWCEFPVRDYYSKDTSVACGAGVIYKMNDSFSYIITNYHVVYYSECQTTNKIASKIHVFQYGTSEYAYETGNTTSSGYPEIAYGDGAVEAEFIGGALNYDIAILKVKTADLLKYNANATAVEIAQGYELAETAIAIGNPETEGISVTSGIISVISEDIQMTGADDVTQCEFRVMRIDTAVNGGNSGGGLFNINGELIGIVNAKVVDSQIDNIAYALPFDNVISVADNLIYYYEKTNSSSQVKKLVLKITLTAENSRAIYNPTTGKTTLKEDIVVYSVTSSLLDSGIGHLIGLQAGDIIKSIKINETEYQLNRMYELGDLLLTIRPSDKFVITVERNNLEQKLGITTEEGVLESQLTIIK